MINPREWPLWLQTIGYFLLSLGCLAAVVWLHFGLNALLGLIAVTFDFVQRHENGIWIAIGIVFAVYTIGQAEDQLSRSARKKAHCRAEVIASLHRIDADLQQLLARTTTSTVAPGAGR